ncbi:MAG: hypothetical protein H6620_07020 [Halobacteriovoraceae bacterium]|nr:hypothetical protein [Halobacteriovoraceae bacterium]
MIAPENNPKNNQNLFSPKQRYLNKPTKNDGEARLENWFLYWRVSPSMWEAKLSQFEAKQIIYVPINWAFHCIKEENGVHYDFGRHRNDCNLKAIDRLAQKLRLQIIYLIPMTPMPLFSNGGVPDWLMSENAMDETGLVQAVIGFDQKIWKIPSVYHPRVIKYYQHFLSFLGQVFISEGFQSRVYGASWGYYKGDQFVSTLFDESEVFEQAFARFKKINVSNISKQSDAIKQNFRQTMRELFAQIVEDSMGSYWAGSVQFSVLGTEPWQFYYRLACSQMNEDDLWENLFSSLSHNSLPTKLLMEKKYISKTLEKAFDYLVDHNYHKEVLGQTLYDDNSESQYSPLVFVEIMNMPKKDIQFTGLGGYLKEIAPYQYRVSKLSKENLEDETDKLYILKAAHLSDEEFIWALRLFLNGKKVILDVSELSADRRKRFDLFTMENGLKGQYIQNIGPVNYYKFGRGEFVGELVTYEGNTFDNETPKSKKTFWKKILNYLDVNPLKVKTSPKVKWLVYRRYASSFELKYQEIRRVFVFNSSHTKEKVFVANTQHSVFIKYLNPENAEVVSSTSGLSVELKPGGSIILDFGYFSKTRNL